MTTGPVGVAARQSESVETLAWTPDGTGLAVGDLAGGLVILAGAGLRPAARPPGHPGGVTALAWEPAGEMLASGGLDGVVRFWSAGAVPPAAGVDGRVNGLAWSPSGRWLAVAAGVSVSVFDRAGWHVAHFPVLPGAVHAVTWARGPAPLAAATHDGVVWLSANRGGEPAAVWEATGAVRVLALDPTRSRLASGDLGGTVRVTDLATHDEVAVSGWPDRIHRLAWDATGARLAVPGGDDITVWSFDGVTVRDDEPVRLRAHRDRITDVAYGGRAGTELAAGGVDGRVVRWTPDRPRHPWPAQLGSPVHTLAWAPGGARLAVGTRDGSVHLL